MTREQFLQRFPGSSESTLRRNGYAATMVELRSSESKSNNGRKSVHYQLDKSTSGVEYRILIISCRTKLVDGHDNIRTMYKQLVDAITATLRFASDSNPRLHWEYGQVIGGEPGTIVKITRYATQKS